MYQLKQACCGSEWVEAKESLAWPGETRECPKCKKKQPFEAVDQAEALGFKIGQRVEACLLRGGSSVDSESSISTGGQDVVKAGYIEAVFGFPHKAQGNLFVRFDDGDFQCLSSTNEISSENYQQGYPTRWFRKILQTN
jgi:hypothetical protein